MPATSQAQQKFMAICAHNPAHAHGTCPSQKVAEEFSHAPGGRKSLPERKEPPKGGKK